jgi:tetratricopeptide (TPR) repeat protein
MGFTKKQKNFILKNFTELPIQKIAEILNCSTSQVSEFLITQNLQGKSESKTNIKNLKKIKDNFFGDFEYKKFKVILEENLTFWILNFVLLFLLYFNSFNAALLSDELTMFQDIQTKGFNWINLFYGTAANHYWSWLLFGYNPWGNRLLALVLHCINILLFFAIFRNFISEKILKVAIVLLVSHSLIVETITWVAANPYTYHTLLYLLILYSSFLYERTNKIYYLIPYYLLTLNLSLSGGHTNFAPLLAIAFNLFILKRSFKKELIISFWLLLSIPVYSFLNKTTVDSRIASLTTGPYFEKFLQTLPFTTAKSLELVFVPYNLALFHEETLNPYYYTFARALTIFFIFFGIYLLTKKEKRYFGLYAIASAFCVYIFSPIQISWFVAERYLYFPVFIVCIFLAMFFFYLNSKIQHLGDILFGLYFCFFLVVSLNRIETWSTLPSLWEANVKIAPDSYRVRNNLAESYNSIKRFDLAEKQYLEAIRINPNFAEANFNLSNALLMQNKFSEAEIYLIKTLELNPSILEAYARLAIIYANTNRFSEAYSVISQAQSVNPGYEVINNLYKELKAYEAKQKN